MNDGTRSKACKRSDKTSRMGPDEGREHQEKSRKRKGKDMDVGVKDRDVMVWSRRRVGAPR